MHVCSDFSEYQRLTSIAIELTHLDLHNTDCIECECWEGCEMCQEGEREWLFQFKETNNTIIEEWMREEEIKHGFNDNDICPTGNTRHDWVMNFR